MARKRKPEKAKMAEPATGIKMAEPATPKKADSAYWNEVVEAMATKKTPPRRPRG